MKPLTTSERLLVNRSFWSVMVRNSVWDAYWVDATRMVSVRQVIARRELPPPPGAIHVGRYDPSVTWEQFIADLEDTLKHREAA